MSNYYYNEKKGRYEPISEAPFGIAPREKRQRNVFTADEYKKKRDDRFDRPYERDTTMSGQGSSAGNWETKFDQSMNRLDDILSQKIAQTTQSTSSNTYNRPKTTSSSSSNNQKGATKKAKSSVGLIIGVIWIFIWVVRSCADSFS